MGLKLGEYIFFEGEDWDKYGYTPNKFYKVVEKSVLDNLGSRDDLYELELYSKISNISFRLFPQEVVNSPLFQAIYGLEEGLIDSSNNTDSN